MLSDTPGMQSIYHYNNMSFILTGYMSAQLSGWRAKGKTGLALRIVTHETCTVKGRQTHTRTHIGGAIMSSKLCD